MAPPKEDRLQQLLGKIQARLQASKAASEHRRVTEGNLERRIEASRKAEKEKQHEVDALKKQLQSKENELREIKKQQQELTKESETLKREHKAAEEEAQRISDVITLTVCLNQHIWKQDLLTSTRDRPNRASWGTEKVR
jgi:chromosome segregation ATPase